MTNLPKRLYLDADRFSQVINNLVENAVKFTPVTGCVEIFIQSSALPNAMNETYPKELRTEFGSGSHCQVMNLSVAVSDTGIGLFSVVVFRLH
jgi:signal transduction histidine kinase